MGTPLFAVPCLKMLVEEKYEIVCVVTQPDRPKGRGGKYEAPPTKLFAIENRLTVAQPENVDAFYEEACALAPDLFITVAFGGILKQRMLDVPKRGCINVHASLLPRYRGPSPMQQALLNGDNVTGITTMLTDKGIDTGDILLKQTLEIPPDMYFDELHDRMALLGADTLKKTIPLYLSGEIIPEKQDHTQATKAPMLRKEISVIDFSQNADQIINKVRALNPWPGTLAELDGKKLKIIKAHLVEMDAACQTENLQPGVILDVTKDVMVVACGKGSIGITVLQFQNKKPMDISACWHNIKKGSLLKGGVFD